MKEDNILYGNFRLFVYKCAIAFIIIWGLLALLSLPTFDYNELYIFQGIFFAIFISVLYISKIKLEQIPVFIFLLQIILTSYLFYYYNFVLDLPYGFDAVDAYTYEKLTSAGQYKSFSEFWEIVKRNEYNFTDFGFLFIRRFVSYITADILIQNYILVILNCLVVSLFIYRLGKLSLHFFSPKISKLLIAFVGLNPFITYTACSGMKENFFMFILISFFLFYYKFLDKGKAKDLFLLIFYAFLTLFFRWFLTIFIFLVVILRPVYLKKRVEKVIPPAIILLLIAAGFFSRIVTSDNDFIKTAQAVQEHRSGGALGLTINFISAWIGPFPSFISKSQIAPLIYAVGNFVKLLFSLYFLLGAYLIFKEKKKQYYPLILFTFSNIFLVIISNTALDMRFVFMSLPFYFIICFEGLKNRNQFRNIIWKESIYYLMSCLIIILYNLR